MQNKWRFPRHTFILTIALLLALAASLFIGSLVLAQSTPPDRRFGAVEAFRAPKEAAELGVGWERIIFFWNQLQPNGPDDWNIFHVEDGWLAEAALNGREVVALLEGTPDWATEGSLGAGVPSGLYLPIDDPGNLWATFVRTVVNRYKGRVNHWIIWNEPDIAPGEYGVQWEGTVADFVQLMKVAYLVARQENPDAVIHFPGLTYWHDVVNRRPLYLLRYIDEARKDPDAAAHNLYFDAVSLHIYFTTDSIYDITAEFAGLLRRNGLPQPIWINETNAAPYDDPLNPWTIPDWTVTLDQQAGFIVEAFAQGLAAGAQRIAVYKFADVPPYPPGYEPYGMVRSDGTRRPAFEALRAAITHFSGAQSASLDRTATRSVITLNRGDKTTRVLWARVKSDVPVSLPALAPQAALVTHLGETTTITPADGVYRLTLPGALCNDPKHGCALGGAPLIVVEEASTGGAPPPQAVDEATPGTIAPDAVEATSAPTRTPTITPSQTPTRTPSPTATASVTPTRTPTPSATPSPSPSVEPSLAQGLSSVSGVIVLALAAGAAIAVLALNRRRRGASR